MSDREMAEPWVLVLLGTNVTYPSPELLHGNGAGDLLAACWRIAQQMTRSERIFVLCNEHLESFVVEFTPGLSTNHKNCINY